MVPARLRFRQLFVPDFKSWHLPCTLKLNFQPSPKILNIQKQFFLSEKGLIKKYPIPFRLLKFVPWFAVGHINGTAQAVKTLKYHLQLYFHLMGYSHFSLTSGYDGMVSNIDASGPVGEMSISWQNKTKHSKAQPFC